MERSRDHDEIAVALAEVRPAPRPEFAAELDQLVSDGFPCPTGGRARVAALAARLGGIGGGSTRRQLLAAGASALALIAITTMVVAGTESGSGPIALRDRTAEQSSPQPSGVQYTEAVPQAGNESSAASATGGYGPDAGDRLSTESLPSSSPLGRSHRQIERSAEIGLLADPADVAMDSAKVFGAVHDAHGIVLHSTTTAGRHAGADFDLLIPSTRLGDALAAFSAIDEVRTRHEATTDITAPTVAVGEQLQDSQAKIDGLLAQLATTESESEREALEIELSRERHHAAVLRTHLDQLHRRTDYSRVSVRIEAGASASGSSGGWGIDNAFHDAGHILGIAAGVTLIALAVLTPLALIALLAWLAHRLWLRTRREHALDT